PGLAMTDTTPYVFIPDIHLVPEVDAERFPWVTARDVQTDALERVARLLGRLRGSDPTLRVWQLGDRHELIDALCNDAGMLLLAGNHDQELIDFRWAGGPQALNTVILNRGTSAADTVLAHGHQFDPIESLSRGFTEFFARGAT